MTEFRYRTVSEALPNLMREVMDGEEVGSRGGQRTRELLHTHIVLEQPWRREVLVPGRKASLPAQIAETMWVLAGRNDIGWLSHYLPRAAEFSDDGQTWRGGYGPRLRSWSALQEKEEGGQLVNGEFRVDQLAHVVDLLRKDPTTRRAVMAIYDPAVDTADGKDIPCNDFLMFASRLGHLHLSVHTRSNDLMWGWSGINAFEWSALQEIVAGLLGLRVGELHFSINSLHVYDRHWQKAERLAQTETLAPWAGQASPRFDGGSPEALVDFDEPYPWMDLAELDTLIARWFEIEQSIREQAQMKSFQREIEPLIHSFPEPMMRSWLRVIAWHWTGDEGYLEPLAGTALHQAALWSPKKEPSAAEVVAATGVTGEEAVRSFTAALTPDPFTDSVVRLHEEKHAAYGDSWKRRGEMLGILANIARKVDRLGGSETADETSADTAIDLLVYLVKYRLWLTENAATPNPFGLKMDWEHGWAGLTDDPEPVAHALRHLGKPEEISGGEAAALADQLKTDFDRLEQLVVDKMLRWVHVDRMITRAHRLAGHLWKLDQGRKEPRGELPGMWEPADLVGGEADRDLNVSVVSLSERNATRVWSGYGE